MAFRQPKGSTIGIIKTGATVQQKFDSLDQSIIDLTNIVNQINKGGGGENVGTPWLYLATGGETSFTITSSATIASISCIFINGTRQEPTINFTYDSATKKISLVGFSLVAGDQVVVIILDGTNPTLAKLASTSGASLIGMSTKGTVQDAIKYVTPEMFGFIPNSTNDQSDSLQSAIYYANNNKTFLYATPSQVCYVSKTIYIPPTLQADWRGFIIKTVTSGITAVSLSTGSANTTLPYRAGTPLDNLTIEGRFKAGTTSTPDSTFTSDGLFVGSSTSTQTSDLGIKNLKVVGFRDAVVVNGPSSYLLQFYSPKIGASWRRGFSWLASSDSGENVQFFGGSIFNCINENLTGSALYHSAASTGLDITFNGVSFDYNDTLLAQLHSTFRFNNCHIENNNNQPFITIQNTSQRVASQLVLSNCAMGKGPGQSPLNSESESSSGRPCFIDVLGANTSINIQNLSGGIWMTTPYVTQVVRNTKGHELRKLDITLSGDFGTPTTQGWPYNPSFFTNKLFLGASGSTVGWTLPTGNGISLSADTTPGLFAGHDTGSRLLKRAAYSSATSMSYYQDIPVRQGDSLIIKAWLYTTNVTSSGGSSGIRLIFLDDTKTVTISDNVQPRQTTADGVLTECSSVQRVPNGAGYLRLQIYCSGISTGSDSSVYGSGERVWTF